MRHFRFHLIAAVILLAAVSSLIALLVGSGRIASALLALPLWIGAAVWIFITARRPVRIMNSFAKAFDEADTTARMPPSDDPRLNELSEIMNRLAAVHRSALMSIETRKLYYDRILRIMTHEMRNSIAPIISLSADLTSRFDSYDKDDIMEAASLIHDQGEGIKKFLDSYYELTHLPRPVMEMVDGLDFFRSIERIAEVRALELGLRREAISFIIARNLTFRADRDMLTRAVVNIIRNALEASAAVEDPRIEVTAGVLNGYVIITVADNGLGISHDVAENIFLPFFTTKNDGSGIGLCLARQISRLHGGDLSLVNSGRGATATLSLEQ